MKKLLPVILILLGAGGGVGAGIALKPAPEVVEGAEGESAEAECDPYEDGHCGDGAGYAMSAEVPVALPDPDVNWEYVKLAKQFVVPVIKKERVSALVVVTISIETVEGTSGEVLAKQPRIRDAFLQVLFAHANSGGFDGAFTTGQSMHDLRGSLREMARAIVGSDVNTVLIEEIVKQQM